MTPVNILDITRRDDFRKWLTAYCATEKECWKARVFQRPDIPCRLSADDFSLAHTAFHP